MKKDSVTKKKLLVTASTFPRWKGDSEPRFILDLLSHMADDFDITVLVPMADGAKETEEMEGVTVIRYHYFPIHKWETLCYPGAIVPRIHEKKIRIFLVPFLFLSLYFNILRLIKNYDLVHAHWMIPQGVIQSFFKKPFTVTGHGGDVTALNFGVIKKLKSRCLEKASKVTAVSSQLKMAMSQIYDRTDIEVISMGCNLKCFGREHYQVEFFGQEGKKVVLFVGRLAEKKGVSYLIEAMAQIEALLIIVGDGPLKSALKEQASILGNKVQFWGAKNHNELKTIYASADLLAVPSITAENGDKEGLPTTIMEAMASGLPVIASNTGGIAEIITDGINGLLCDERNSGQLSYKIKTLLKDDNLRERLSVNAEKVIQKYDYHNIAGQFKKVLLSSCAENGENEK